MLKFRKGAKVVWRWGAHTAQGRVIESFVEHVSRIIKGEMVKRSASKQEPAYLIEQEDSDCVLKSHSELRKVS